MSCSHRRPSLRLRLRQEKSLPHISTKPAFRPVCPGRRPATSNYNALQLNAQRRATKGLFLGVSYTWSKVMASSLSGGTNDNSFVRPDQYNRQANYAPASFDRRQLFAINYVYTSPKFIRGN